MTAAELVATSLVASFLGSLHCAAMCGGLVSALGLAAPGAGASATPTVDRCQLAFHAGRLVVYALLGAVAGILGQGLNLAGAHAGIVQAAALVSGGFLLIAGLYGLSAAGGLPLPGLRFGRGVVGGFAAAARRVRPTSPRGTFVLGLATSWLPCGWLYAFVVSAAGTGSAAFGALVMVAFWLGGVPALLGLGALVARLAAPLKRQVPLVSAALLVILGLGAILGRLNLPAAALEKASSALSDPARPPCH